MKIDLGPILKLDLKDRFEYLRQNKASLIATKKSTPQTYDYKESVFDYGYSDKASIAGKLKDITVLMFETVAKRLYNAIQFQMYLEGGVKQHSIGLQYIDLILALNDPEDKEHYRNWNKYLELSLNPEKAEREGFFFVSKEYRLIENSDVLYGANELTPTIDMTEIDKDNILVRTVANTPLWIDEQMDLLMPGAPQKSIKERGHLIPHLSNHTYSTEAKIGEVKGIYEMNIDLNKYIKAGISPLQKQAVNAPVDFSKIMFNLKF
jgi:hypothetical protein